MTTPTLRSPRVVLPDAGWQGIAWLELEIHEAPATPPSATLRVHLNVPQDGTLTDADVAFSGGRRILDRDLTFAVFFDGLDVIRLEFDRIGDRSLYTVALLDGGGTALHPFFAAASFAFTVDCPAGDCVPLTITAEPPLAPRPALDLATKDFEGFVALLSERAVVVDPSWSDLSPASLERVLVDLLAYGADELSLYQDRVINEAFVDTATQRYSLDQHAALLGVPTGHGRAALTVLAFEVTHDGFVPAGLMVRMPATTDESRVVFHTLTRTAVSVARNAAAMVWAGWPGAADAAIPEDSTELRLWGHDLALREGDRIALAQGDVTVLRTVSAVEELDEPGWTDDPVGVTVPNVAPQAITRVALTEPVGATLWPWPEDPDAPDVPPLRLHANLVDARHGALRTAWIDPSGAVPRDQAVLTLTPANSTVVGVVRSGGTARHLRQLELPEGPVAWGSDGDGLLGPLVEVRVDDEAWTRQEHLHNSRSYDLHYVAEATADGGIWLRFGDGVHGHEIEVRPVAPIEVRLQWYVGEPTLGNVGAETLTEVVPPSGGADAVAWAALGAVTVTNVVPASGGTAPESLDAIRRAIPDAIRHGVPGLDGRRTLQRAVTLDDYARVAEEVPGVGRAAARALGGPFNTVLVLVDPVLGDAATDAALSDTLRDEVQAWLDRRRMAGREVVVQAADYVPLDVSLALCVEPGYPRHQVRDRVLAALRPGTRALPGWFHPDRLSFAQSVELGELLAVVQRMDGVRSVRAVAFKPLLRPDVPEVVPRIVLGTTEIARLDADDDFPENGRLKVLVVGLDLPASVEDDYDVVDAGSP